MDYFAGDKLMGWQFIVRLLDSLVSDIRREIHEEAIKVLERWGNDDSIGVQVQALIGSLDDTLSDEVILSELRTIEAKGLPFAEVFASTEETIDVTPAVPKNYHEA
ncbi:MAG TPA: hypothetical protein VGI60_02695 [Chthoniobacterales bacterium]